MASLGARRKSGDGISGGIATREHMAKAGSALETLRGIFSEQFHPEINGKGFWRRCALA